MCNTFLFRYKLEFKKQWTLVNIYPLLTQTETQACWLILEDLEDEKKIWISCYIIPESVEFILHVLEMRLFYLQSLAFEDGNIIPSLY